MAENRKQRTFSMAVERLEEMIEQAEADARMHEDSHREALWTLRAHQRSLAAIQAGPETDEGGEDV